MVPLSISFKDTNHSPGYIIESKWVKGMHISFPRRNNAIITEVLKIRENDVKFTSLNQHDIITNRNDNLDMKSRCVYKLQIFTTRLGDSWVKSQVEEDPI